MTHNMIHQKHEVSQKQLCDAQSDTYKMSKKQIIIETKVIKWLPKATKFLLPGKAVHT